MLIALTRPVPTSIVRCELTHLARQAIDVERAAQQHDDYAAALRRLGCDVRVLSPAPELPDSVFVEDAAVVLDECAVIARPGAESRRGEVDGVAEALRPYRRLHAIEPPGTLDGGDVLTVGRRVFVGLSSRTNTAGAGQLEAALAPYGYRLKRVVVRDCLHLKTAATALGSEMLLIDPARVSGRAFGGLSWIEVDPAEPYAANVLAVGERLLCAATAVDTMARLVRQGFSVTPLDVSELAKAEAGLTCCSLIFHGSGR